jgi:hypothetical protein
LTFGAVRDPHHGSSWSRLLEAIREAVAVITPKELAYRLDIQPSYLSEALVGRDRKGVRAEWMPTILAMAPEGARVAILTELAAPVGLEVVRRTNLTPEERLQRLEQRIASEFGAMGARLVEDNRR